MKRIAVKQNPRNDLIDELLIHIKELNVYDVGSVGELQGPLGSLHDINKLNYFGFEPDNNVNYPTPKDWWSNIEKKSGRINVPFLCGKEESYKLFFRTKQAQCSSCLIPALNEISDYHDNDRYTIENKTWYTMTSIDEMHSLTKKKPSLIKIDAQGYDLEILKGAKSSIDNKKSWILIEMCAMKFYKEQATIGQISRFLEKKGYSLRKLYPVYHSEVTLGANKPAILSFFDGLWCPKTESDWATERLYEELLLETIFNICFFRKSEKLIRLLNNEKLIPLVNKLAMCIGKGLDNYEDHNPLGAIRADS